jgi:DNA polymerase III delta subunit
MPPPMMADAKIVTVTGLQISSMRQEDMSAFLDALEALKEYDYNVLIISVPSGMIDEGTPKRPSAALTKLSEHLTPVCFDSISESRLVSWVGKHFEHYGAHASAETCAFLIEYSGRSMFTLSFETEKLARYVLYNGRDTVTDEDVKNVAVSVISEEAYALTNAIMNSSAKDALEALAVMKFRRADPVNVMGEVSGTVFDMVAVKSLLDKNTPFADIARTVRDKKGRPMNEFKLKRYINAVSRKSLVRLKELLSLCSQADLALKLSAQGYEEIEKLICGL